MKRNIIFLVLAALIILAAPIFVAAQTVAPATTTAAVTTPVTSAPAIPIKDATAAILALVNGYWLTAPIVEWLKKKLGTFFSKGFGASLLTFVEVAIGTAAYLLWVIHDFTVTGLIICVVVTFGVASGKYTIDLNTNVPTKS